MSQFERPAGLEWGFIEQFYPDYSYSDAVLQSDDMSFVSEECADNWEWQDCPVTAESQSELCRLSGEWAYRVKNAFDGCIGLGLTYYQAQTRHDDELYVKAVANAPASAVMPHTSLWAWAYEQADEPTLRAWYASLKYSG